MKKGSLTFDEGLGEMRFRALGEIIRDAREAKGMSKAHLSKISGVSQNSLVKYEKCGIEDGIEPSLKNIVRIAAALDIDPRRIFDSIVFQHAITKHDADHELNTFSVRLKWRDEEKAMSNFRDENIAKIVSALTEIDRDQDAGWQYAENTNEQLRKAEQRIAELEQKQSGPD